MLFRIITRKAILQTSVVLSTLGVGMGGVSDIVDLRGIHERHGEYPMRDMKKVNTIVFHHTATTAQGWGSINDFHRVIRKWSAIGYHFGASWDARVFQHNDIDRRTNHCGGCNTTTVGFAFLGNYDTVEASPELLSKVEGWTRFVMELYPNITKIKYHGELVATRCPGTNVITWVKDFRVRLAYEKQFPI